MAPHNLCTWRTKEKVTNKTKIMVISYDTSGRPAHYPALHSIVTCTLLIFWSLSGYKNIITTSDLAVTNGYSPTAHTLYNQTLSFISSIKQHIFGFPPRIFCFLRYVFFKKKKRGKKPSQTKKLIQL